MEINQELIACYIDGTATEEERNLVRKYMCEHPSCYEEMLSLIERTKDAVEEKCDTNIEICSEQSIPSLGSVSAASNNRSIFKSVKNFMTCSSTKKISSDVSFSMQVKRKPKNNLNKEISNMLDELNDIL